MFCKSWLLYCWVLGIHARRLSRINKRFLEFRCLYIIVSGIYMTLHSTSSHRILQYATAKIDFVDVL